MHQVRLEAMRHLLHFPPGDLVSCENWATLQEAVGNALMEDNAELAVSINSVQAISTVEPPIEDTLKEDKPLNKRTI